MPSCEHGSIPAVFLVICSIDNILYCDYLQFSKNKVIVKSDCSVISLCRWMRMCVLISRTSEM